MTLLLVDGPALRLTLAVVANVTGCGGVAGEEPVSVKKSDLMKPVVPFCLTLDQSPCIPRTSTLVFGVSVLIMLWLNDAPVLKLTAPVVRIVAITVSAGGGVPVDVPPLALPSPPRVRKSDLIKPLIPFALTLDQPAGSCSVTSTQEPLATVVTTRESIDAEALTLTPAVVVNVAAVLPTGNFRKSDLIKPVVLPALTLDQPAGL